MTAKKATTPSLASLLKKDEPEVKSPTDSSADSNDTVTAKENEINPDSAEYSTEIAREKAEADKNNNDDEGEVLSESDNQNKPPVVVRPEDIEPPVDNTDVSDTNSYGDDRDKADTTNLSPQVVGTVPNKTPAELSSETPKQTAQRYGIDQTITDEDADNPRVDLFRDTHVNQVPSGTHLHPDIAKDLMNRGISEQHTDNAAVRRTSTEYYSFAPDAEHNDKF